jgi:hypothetical protein
LVCYFAQRLWQSAFLRENNPTIITSFGKLTGWFAMLAHRRQLTNRPKESRPKVAPQPKTCCSGSPMVKKPWRVERVSDDSYYVQGANGAKLACVLQASFPRRGAKRFFRNPHCAGY